MCLNKDIEDHIKTIVSTVSGMDSIWLIGSRANGTATENSDWDLLIFGPANIHKTIKNYPELRRKDIDLLVFEDQDNFSTPWETGKKKSGSLSKWKWSPVNGKDNEATYEAAVFIKDEESSNKHGAEMGISEHQIKRAIRIWANNT